MDIKKRTKIVATIGPVSSSPKIIKALIKAGINIARLNFSHGNYAEKREQIENIRNTAKKLKAGIAIMADLQGPKLRLGVFNGPKEIRQSDIIIFSPDAVLDEIPIQLNLAPFLKTDERMFINDGLIEFKIIGVGKKKIKVEAQDDGTISSKNGINIPDSIFNSTIFTKKDEDDLEFALNHKVDYVALSFIQTASDLDAARQMIRKYNSKTKIISKIETRKAVENMEEIIKDTDIVVVARGDLGIEIKASLVPLVQQKIINLAKQFKKPVIIATHMLESMVNHPRPTRAEVSDVANAVLSNVDAVWLSAETASGKYPVKAVSTMNEIIHTVEEFQKDKNFLRPCRGNL